MRMIEGGGGTTPEEQQQETEESITSDPATINGDTGGDGGAGDIEANIDPRPSRGDTVTIEEDPEQLQEEQQPPDTNVTREAPPPEDQVTRRDPSVEGRTTTQTGPVRRSTQQAGVPLETLGGLFATERGRRQAEFVAEQREDLDVMDIARIDREGDSLVFNLTERERRRRRRLEIGESAETGFRPPGVGLNPGEPVPPGPRVTPGEPRPPGRVGAGTRPIGPGLDSGVNAPLDIDFTVPGAAVESAGSLRAELARTTRGVTPGDIRVRETASGEFAVEITRPTPGETFEETLTESRIPLSTGVTPGRASAVSPLAQVARDRFTFTPTTALGDDVELPGPSDVIIKPRAPGADVGVEPPAPAPDESFSEEILSEPSPGARFFGTQARERAIEQEAQEGSPSAQLFVGGEALEQVGLEATRELGDALEPINFQAPLTVPQPLGVGTTQASLNPRPAPGLPRIGESLRRTIVEAPAGVGVAAGLGPKAAGDIGLRVEEALGRDVDDPAVVGGAATLAAVQRAGRRTARGVREDPVSAGIAAAAPFVVSRVSPVRFRRADIPTRARTDAGVPVSRRVGAGVEAVRRGESPSVTSQVEFDVPDPTPTTRVSAVRLETPQVFGGGGRGVTLAGRVPGQRPTLGAPSLEPQQIAFERIGSSPTRAAEPMLPTETDVFQATGRGIGGTAAARTRAVERVITEALDERAIATAQRIGRARARAAERLPDAPDVSLGVRPRVARGIEPVRSAAAETRALATTAVERAAMRGGDVAARGVRAGQRARRAAPDPFEPVDQAAFRLGQRIGERSLAVDEAVGRVRGRLEQVDDAAFQAGQRVGQGVSRVETRLRDLDPFEPVDQAAFQAGRRVGERVAPLEEAIPSVRPLRGERVSARELVEDVRSVPQARVEQVVEALQETDATVFGSASIAAQTRGFRTPRDLDIVVPDKPSAQLELFEALEGRRPETVTPEVRERVSEVFDIKTVEEAPGRAAGGEALKFGRESLEKLETEEGIPITPVDEELVRKAGASGFLRGEGTAGTARADVGPEPRRPGRVDVREKDVLDTVAVAESELGAASPAVREFREAFSDLDEITEPLPVTETGQGFLGDVRAQAGVGGRAAGATRELDADVRRVRRRARAVETGRRDSEAVDAESPATRPSRGRTSPRVSGGVLAASPVAAPGGVGSPVTSTAVDAEASRVTSPITTVTSPTRAAMGVSPGRQPAAVTSPLASPALSPSPTSTAITSGGGGTGGGGPTGTPAAPPAITQPAPLGPPIDGDQNEEKQQFQRDLEPFEKTFEFDIATPEEVLRGEFDESLDPLGDAPEEP